MAPCRAAAVAVAVAATAAVAVTTRAREPGKSTTASVRGGESTKAWFAGSQGNWSSLVPAPPYMWLWVGALQIVLGLLLLPQAAHGDGALLKCGSSNGADPAKDSEEMIAAFSFIKTVCSVDMGEDQKAGAFLPSTCRTPQCSRAVALVNASCAKAFSAPCPPCSFLQQAFQPEFEPLAQLCAERHARPTLTPVARISDPGLHTIDMDSGCRGELADGMGPGGYRASPTGQDSVVLVAAPGEEVELVLKTLYLSRYDNIRLYTNGALGGDATATLVGQELPPLVQSNRTFRSSGGKMAVLKVTGAGESGEASSFSFGYTLSAKASRCPPPPPPPPPPGYCSSCQCMFGCESAGSFSNDKWCDVPWTRGSRLVEVTQRTPGRSQIGGRNASHAPVAAGASTGTPPVSCAGGEFPDKGRCIYACWQREFGFAACQGPFEPPGPTAWSSPNWTPCGAPPPPPCGEPHSKRAGCGCCSSCGTYCPQGSANCHGSSDKTLACCASSCGLGCLSCDYYCDPSC